MKKKIDNNVRRIKPGFKKHTRTEFQQWELRTVWEIDSSVTTHPVDAVAGEQTPALHRETVTPALGRG